MNINNIRKAINDRKKQLDSPFDEQRSLYSEIQEFVLPWNGLGLSGEITASELTDGAKKDDSIYDSTGNYAVEVLSAGMQSGLTSPSRPWFRLALADESLREIPAVKNWLYAVENAMRYTFSRSNVYQALHHSYMELAGFGTAAMAVLADFDNVIRCRPFTIGEYRLALSPKLAVDTFLHYSYMTNRQIVSRFGEENCSTQLVNAHKNGQCETLTKIGWLIEPNDDRLKAKDWQGRPFRSVWFEDASSEDKLLSVSGFDSFPVLAPRWHVVGNKTWGVGPGHATLSNVKMLQKLQEKALIALDKWVDPPLVGPTTAAQTKINTMPGGVTCIDEMANTAGLRPLYDTRPDIQALEMKIQQVQTQIKTGYYNDLFLMLANQPLRTGITATEIAARHEEKLTMLGPVLERLHTELLDPLIDRTFDIMMRNNAVPQPPEEIQGAEIKVEYISILAQAQKMVGVNAVNQFTGFIGGIAQMNPEVIDTIDFDEMVNIYGDMTGVPPKVIAAPEVVEAKRQQRQQQMQQQQMASMMQPAAQTAKALGDTALDSNSALDALLGRPQ